MKTCLSRILLLMLAAIFLNELTTTAQGEPLPRPDAPIKIIKPDRAVIERIRAEFERLPTKLDVIYDSKESDQVGGFFVFSPPKYLNITLAGPAAQFIKGKGLRETDLRCEPIFALTPYLDTNREKEAFVILMAVTREFYGHKTALSPALPFGKDFDPAAWEASKADLIAKLREACIFCLEAGAETGWRRKYDVSDLALERLPANSTAKPHTQSAASGARTSDDGQSPLPKPSTPPNERSADSAAQTSSVKSEEPTSSTPWSIIVVLIVAATGLLWLLLKGRK
jgi:hypothetical protein